MTYASVHGEGEELVAHGRDALERLLFPQSPADFLTRYWGRDYFIGHGDPDRFGSLFSWNALSKILSTHRFEFPRLRLLSGGRVAPPSQYMLSRVDRRGNPFVTHDAAAVGRLMARGAMLHITSIGETWPPLADFAASLERSLGGRVQVNLHAGFAGSRGFHAHWDGHDVYAAQIDGSKVWRLFGFTAEAPLAVPPDEKHGAPTKHVWEGIVGLGDMLYLPRGYWHATEYRADPSLHLTFAVQHATGLDFLQWLLPKLANSPAVRRDIPSHLIPELAQAPSVQQVVDGLQQQLLGAVTAGALTDYLNEYGAQLGTLNRVTLSPRTESQHDDSQL